MSVVQLLRARYDDVGIHHEPGGPLPAGGHVEADGPGYSLWGTILHGQRNPNRTSTPKCIM